MYKWIGSTLIFYQASIAAVAFVVLILALASNQMWSLRLYTKVGAFKYPNRYKAMSEAEISWRSLRIERCASSLLKSMASTTIQRVGGLRDWNDCSTFLCPTSSDQNRPVPIGSARIPSWTLISERIPSGFRVEPIGTDQFRVDSKGFQSDFEHT